LSTEFPHWTTQQISTSAKLDENSKVGNMYSDRVLELATDAHGEIITRGDERIYNLINVVQAIQESGLPEEGHSIVKNDLWEREARTLPPLPHYEIPDKPTLQTPKFSVQTDQMSMTQTIVSHSLTGSEMYCGLENLRKFLHVFTFAPLGIESVSSIDDLLGKGDKETALRTPDYYFFRGNWLHVLEVCTRYDSVTAMKHEVRNKLAKYTSHLLERRKNTSYQISLDVICVSSERVISTFDLPSSIVDEMVYRYRLARVLQLELDQYGIKPKYSGDESREDRIRIMKSCFSGMKLEEIGTDYTLKDKAIWDAEITPDEKAYVHIDMQRRFDEALSSTEKEHRVSHNELVIEMNREIKKHLENVDRHSNRTDLKAIIQIPYFNLRKSDGCDFEVVITPRHELTKHTTECQVWYSVFRSIDKTRFKLTPVEEQINFAMTTRKITKEIKRSDYHKIELDLDINSWIDLAKVGINGKKWKDEKTVHDYRLDKKRCFMSDTPTHDLDNLIKKWPLKIFQTSWAVDATEETELLIDSALQMHMVNQNSVLMWTKVIKGFMRSTIYNFFSMISAIGVQLTASLRQNCKVHEFRLHQLKDWPLYLLIKPTRANKHVHVSFACFECHLADADFFLMNNTVFKKWEKIGDLYCTEFVSFTADKLENLVKAGPLSIALFVQWLRFRDQKVVCPESIDWSSVYEYLVLTMIIGLNDKSKTEEISSQFRHLSMELFKQHPEKPRPYKVLKKMPTTLRSRLQVWFTKKLIDEMIRGIKDPYQVDIDENGKTQWLNLVDPYMGNRLPSVGHLIELYYLGYICNKNESAQKNAAIKIVEKIIQEEIIVYQPNYDLDWLKGINNARSGKYPKHSFSIPHVKMSGGICTAFLKQQYGKSYHLSVEESITNEILKIDFEKLCTLKASAFFSKENETIQTALKSSATRERVITRMLDLYDDWSDDIFEMLEVILKQVEQDGIRADLFKKNQHGGTREIFVLSREARIIQAIIEAISRGVCKLFKSETMTHPSEKINRPVRHGVNTKKLKAKCSNLTFDANSSNDKSKWNQGNTPSKFYVLLKILTPPWLHNFLFRVIRLWPHRKIMLPIELLEQLNGGMGYGSNEIFNLLKKSVHKITNIRPIHDACNSYIQTKTGFMQGILHYTSSLFHTAKNHMVDYFFHWHVDFLKTRMTFLTTFMQSSDDCSYMVTVSVNEEKDIERAHKVLCTYSRYCDNVDNPFGFIPSVEKSAINTPCIMEFNSEWFEASSLHKPVYKFVPASLVIPERETLSEMQEEFSNGLTTLLESGAPIWQIHGTQVAQAVLYYQILGATLTPMFNECAYMMRRNPDPGLGFFLMSHPLLAGLGGFQYDIWKACKETNLSIRFRNLLDSGLLTTTSSGTFVSGICLRHGDRKKWNFAVKKAESSINFEWKEYIENNPEVLYLGNRDKKSIATRCMVKLTNPSVAASISKNFGLSKIVASAVYICSEPSLRLGDAWYYQGEGKRSDEMYTDRIQFDESGNKYSLYYLLKNMSMSEGARLTSEQERMIFPFCIDYGRMEQQAHVLQDAEIESWVNYTRRKGTVLIAESINQPLCSMDKLCLRKWFKINRTHLPESMFEDEWEKLEDSLPWLKDSVQESLKASQFLNHIQLHNFVHKRHKPSREIRVNAAPLKTYHGETSFENVIRRNLWPGLLLELPGGEGYSTNENKLAHIAASVSGLPYHPTAKYTTFRKILRDESRKKRIITPDIKLVPTRLRPLSLMCSFLMGNLNSKQILQKIYEEKCGIIGGWTIIQNYNVERKRYEGKGQWSGLLDDLPIRMDVMDTEVRSVTVLDLSKFSTYMSMFKNLLKELKLKPSTEKQKDLCISGWKILSGDNVGIRIFNEDPHTMRMEDVGLLSIRFDAQTIRLICKDKQRRREFSMLKHVCRQTDFCRGLKWGGTVNETKLQGWWISDTPSSNLEDWKVALVEWSKRFDINPNILPENEIIKMMKGAKESNDEDVPPFLQVRFHDMLVFLKQSMDMALAKVAGVKVRPDITSTVVREIEIDFEALAMDIGRHHMDVIHQNDFKAEIDTNAELIRKHILDDITDTSEGIGDLMAFVSPEDAGELVNERQELTFNPHSTSNLLIPLVKSILKMEPAAFEAWSTGYIPDSVGMYKSLLEVLSSRELYVIPSNLDERIEEIIEEEDLDLEMPESWADLMDVEE